MGKITLTEIPRVSERWSDQYLGNKWNQVFKDDGTTFRGVYIQLCSVEIENPPDLYDRIDAIIGNKSWTTFVCHCCGTYQREPLVHFENDDGRSNQMCKRCLSKGLKLLRKPKK